MGVISLRLLVAPRIAAYLWASWGKERKKNRLATTREWSGETATVIYVCSANPTLSWTKKGIRKCYLLDIHSELAYPRGPALKAWPSKCLKCNTKQSIERQVMCRTKAGFSTSVTQWERDEWLLAPLRALTDHLKAASFDCDSVIVSQIQSRWALTWGSGNWTFIKVRDCLQAAL